MNLDSVTYYLLNLGPISKLLQALVPLTVFLLTWYQNSSWGQNFLCLGKYLDGKFGYENTGLREGSGKEMQTTEKSSHLGRNY